MKNIMIAALGLMLATSAMAQPIPAVQHGSGKGKIEHKHHKPNTICLGKLCYKPFTGVFVR